MTKLFASFFDNDISEKDAVNAIIENDGCFLGETLENLVEDIEDNGDFPSDVAVFIFELVDKGKIKTSHTFVSSKKVKELKPASV